MYLNRGGNVFRLLLPLLMYLTILQMTGRRKMN